MVVKIHDAWVMLVMTCMFGIIYSGFDTTIVTLTNHNTYERQADKMIHHFLYRIKPAKLNLAYLA